jgi:hypothetical protein
MGRPKKIKEVVDKIVEAVSPQPEVEVVVETEATEAPEIIARRKLKMGIK